MHFCVFGIHMKQARVKMSDRTNQVLNIVKAKYNLKDKSAAIELVVARYESPSTSSRSPFPIRRGAEATASSQCDRRHGRHSRRLSAGTSAARPRRRGERSNRFSGSSRLPDRTATPAAFETLIAAGSHDRLRAVALLDSESRMERHGAGLSTGFSQRPLARLLLVLAVPGAQPSGGDERYPAASPRSFMRGDRIFRSGGQPRQTRFEDAAARDRARDLYQRASDRARRRGLAVRIGAGGFDCRSRRAELRSICSTLFRPSRASATPFADVITTQYRANHSFQRADGAANGKLRIIPNGIDVAISAAIPRDAAPRRPTVLMIGRIVPIKDIRTFIVAVALLKDLVPNVEAILVGREQGSRVRRRKLPAAGRATRRRVRNRVPRPRAGRPEIPGRGRRAGALEHQRSPADGDPGSRGDRARDRIDGRWIVPGDHRGLRRGPGRRPRRLCRRALQSEGDGRGARDDPAQ